MINLAAFARASASSAPVVSTNSQPSPRGSVRHRRPRRAGRERPGPAERPCPRSPPAGAAAGPAPRRRRPACRRSRARPARPRRGVGDQADGGLQRHRQRALGADQEPGQVAAVLGQQLLERVARNLTAEAPELGADHAPAGRAPARRASASSGRTGDRSSAPAVKRVAVGGQHVERDARCRSCGRSPAPASRRRCCRAQPPIVARECVDGSGPNRSPCGRPAAVIASRIAPGSTIARPSLGVDRDHPVEVAREVQHDARSDGVAGDGRPGAAGRSSGDGQVAADRERGHDLVDMTREDHDLRDDPVVRGVRRVLRPSAGRVVDRADAGRAQRVRHVADGRSHPLILRYRPTPYPARPM